MAKTFDLGNGILSVGTIRKEWTVSVPDLLTAKRRPCRKGETQD